MRQGAVPLQPGGLQPALPASVASAGRPAQSAEGAVTNVRQLTRFNGRFRDNRGEARAARSSRLACPTIVLSFSC